MADVLIEGHVILLASGRYVNPLDLQHEDIDIEDIAYALAGQNRYTGYSRPRITVAEHCVRAHDEAERLGLSPEIRFWTLMHDAAEAYLQDMARPLKDHPEFGRIYREFEAKAMAVICDVFDMDPVQPLETTEIDLTMLATERRDLMPANGVWKVTLGVRLLQEKIVPWPSHLAEYCFTRRFYRYR
jgi:hypothetical protein